MSSGAASPSAFGIDVSHLQGTIDWTKVAAAGVQFVFVKATEGATYRDPSFGTNWGGAKVVQLLRGAYHFFHPETDAAAQAASFLNLLHADSGELPPVLDVERVPSVGSKPDRWLAVPAKERASILLAWLNAVETACGRKPMIYTAPAYWRTLLTDSSAFADYPVWLAQYTQAPAPNLPSTWSKWDFWQHSEAGTVAGIATKVDLSRFNGAPEDLLAFAGTPPALRADGAVNA